MPWNLSDDNDELQCWPMSAAAFYAAHLPAAQYFNPAFGTPHHSSPYDYSATSDFGWTHQSHPTIKGSRLSFMLVGSHSSGTRCAAPSVVVRDHDTVPWQQSSRFVGNNPTSCTHCKATPCVLAKELNDIVTMSPAEFLQHMKDRDACNFLTQHFPQSPAVRSALNALLMNPVVLIRLSMDRHGNYFIQKVVEEAGPMTRALLNGFSENMLRLTCNRYGCRVVQKVIECFPIEMVFDIVIKYHGDELSISVDPNASHVIQKVVACHGPEVFEPFVTAYTECIQNFDHVVLNKYGCHVIQKVLEKLVTNMPSSMNASNSLDAKLLSDVVGRIKEKAHVYVFAEFANYIVQFVLVAPSLAVHARYIIDYVIA
ncbi:pumilio-family RNA binding repeat containing protein [Aphelenchoides avenae]|nr:pumilio-family RNA binding repeat containing protein [Aphelenchus avenae]